MTQTQTRNSTYTSTLSKIHYVTRKVQADLLAIVETYGQVTEDYALDFIHDLRIFLDEDVISEVSFIWTKPGTSTVVSAYNYSVAVSGNSDDDRSGGIPYNPLLVLLNFSVRVSYNARWNAMNQNERESLKLRLKLNWGPGGTLDYGNGHWSKEKSYSKDGYGLDRKKFS